MIASAVVGLKTSTVVGVPLIVVSNNAAVVEDEDEVVEGDESRRSTGLADMGNTKAAVRRANEPRIVVFGARRRVSSSGNAQVTFSYWAKFNWTGIGVEQQWKQIEIEGFPLNVIVVYNALGPASTPYEVNKQG